MRAPFRLGAGGTLGVLNLPAAAPGLTLMTQFFPCGFWPIELRAAYFFTVESELSSGELELPLESFMALRFPPEGSGVRGSAAQLDAALCPIQHPVGGGLLLACGGAYVGAAFIEGYGFAPNRSESRLQLGFEAHARFNFAISGGLGFTYSAGVVAPLLRQQFGYHDHDGEFVKTFQVAPVGGRLDLLLTYGFQ